jgi:hypothetical protein
MLNIFGFLNERKLTNAKKRIAAAETAVANAEAAVADAEKWVGYADTSAAFAPEMLAGAIERGKLDAATVKLAARTYESKDYFDAKLMAAENALTEAQNELGAANEAYAQLRANG